MKPVLNTDTTTPDTAIDQASMRPANQDVSSSLRLTIVEDDDALAQMIGKASQHLGFDVTLICDEDSYIRHRSRAKPDVIVLDLNVGFATGLDCLERFIAEDFQGHVILMSGCDDRVFRFSEDICRKLGANLLASLPKPFELQELTRLLKTILPEAPLLTRQEVEQSLKSQEFVPYFQPIMNLKTGQLSGAEILARWQHPRHGLIQPVDFIGPVEDFGLMNDLTASMLSQALEATCDLEANGQPINLSVNVSPSTLLKPDFADWFIDIIHQAGGQPQHVKMELTEGVAFVGIDRIMKILTRLRIGGIKISIDDFGTGFSSLTALHQLPFSELKIDRSFTGRIAQDVEADKIVYSIIDLSHSLGLEVVAEGAENQNIIDILKDKNCDMVQGYFISKPINIQSFSKWINRNTLLL